MPDWVDVKDAYEVAYEPEPGQSAIAQQQPHHDPRCMKVELPGLPSFMKLPWPLQLLVRKKGYIMEVQGAFAARADRLHQGFTQIHGGKSTAELYLTVCVKPPGGIPSRWKDSMRQSMLTGFIKPSTQIKLDYAVLVVTRALCGKPLRMVRRRANIATIHAKTIYAERESVIIELRKDRQFYNIHMR